MGKNNQEDGNNDASEEEEEEKEDEDEEQPSASTTSTTTPSATAAQTSNIQSIDSEIMRCKAQMTTLDSQILYLRAVSSIHTNVVIFVIEVLPFLHF